MNRGDKYAAEKAEITAQARQALQELLETARLEPGSVLVVGCSSSEVLGEKIGTHSSMDAAKAVLHGILPVIRENKLFLAAQCCEHLTRALIVEQAAAEMNCTPFVRQYDILSTRGVLCYAQR